jgi:hypothetical protein
VLGVVLNILKQLPLCGAGFVAKDIFQAFWIVERKKLLEEVMLLNGLIVPLGLQLLSAIALLEMLL